MPSLSRCQAAAGILSQLSRSSSSRKELGELRSFEKGKPQGKNSKAELGVLQIRAAGQGFQHCVCTVDTPGVYSKAPRPLQGLVATGWADQLKCQHLPSWPNCSKCFTYTTCFGEANLAPLSPRRGTRQSWPSSISIGPCPDAARRRRGSGSTS